MLQDHQSVAIYMEGYLGQRRGKMGYGVLRYSPNPVVCVIDSRHAGREVHEVVHTPRRCPVVAGVAEAAALGAEVLLLGIAPPGGRMPEAWLPDIDEAVRRGLSVVNGLHDRLAGRYPALAAGQWIWDIRQEPPGIGVATGAARTLPNRRVLLVGTDMAIGKMTTGLELHHAMGARGFRSEFLATGQIGIVIAGQGVALDAVRLDYASGAVESVVLSVAEAEWIFLEGQGALTHPGSSATLPLLRGLCPTDIVLCHKAGQQTLMGFAWATIPPLRALATLYEDLAEVCDLYPRPRTAGISLDTSACDDDQAAAAAIERIEAETHLPATDVLRFGCEKLTAALLNGN